jgi:hypothetical protein
LAGKLVVGRCSAGKLGGVSCYRSAGKLCGRTLLGWKAGWRFVVFALIVGWKAGGGTLFGWKAGWRVVLPFGWKAVWSDAARLKGLGGDP